MELICPAMLGIAIPIHCQSKSISDPLTNPRVDNIKQDLLVEASRYARSQPQKGSAQAPLNPSFPLSLSLNTNTPFKQYCKGAKDSQMATSRVVGGGAKGLDGRVLTLNRHAGPSRFSCQK
jgi:hypothetical protein